MALYKENIVDIDLAKNRLHRSFLPHSIGTGDVAADRFGIRVFRSGEEVSLTGCSCFGYFRDPMGNNIALTSHGTIDGNLAYITLPQACYNYDGQFTLAIKLVGGGVTGTMRIVDGVVDNTNTGGAVAPTGAVPTYTEVLAVYDQMQEAVEDYDETVTEQNTKIDNIKSALSYSDESITNDFAQITGNRALVFTKGLYKAAATPATGVAVAYGDSTAEEFACAISHCSPGDKFTVRVYGYTGTNRAYFFLDENMQIVSGGSGTAYAGTNADINTRLTAPANSAFVVFTNRMSKLASGYYAYKGEPLVKKTNNNKYGIESILDGIAERVDWRNTASSSYPIGGWIVGSWDEETGAWSSGTRAIATQSAITPPDPDCEYIVAQSFSDTWGISVVEADKDNNYLQTYGTIVGTNRTNIVYVPVNPKHRYKISVGQFQTNEGSSYLTWDNVNNIKVWFGKNENTAKVVDVSRGLVKDTVNANTIGNVQVFYLDDKPMETYKVENGEIVHNNSIDGTDYIKCDSSLLYALQVEPYYDNTAYYIYFYDDQKHLVWDVLDYTDANGRKNRFTPSELLAINGLMFSNLPDGYYMRIGVYQTNSQGIAPRLYVWNGIPFGIKLTGVNGAFNGNSFVNLPTTGGGIISVTQDVDALIAKPGYTFIGARIKNGDNYTNVPNSSLFPCQFLSLNGYPGWRYNKAVMVVKNYDYENGTYDPVAVDGDLSEYVCAIITSSMRQGLSIHSNEVGKSYLINKLIKQVQAIEWECKKDIKKSDSQIYKGGVKYHGIPYRSDWQHASNFGWHVTAHTFVNAANDPDSIFYNGAPYGGSELKPGPYYSLVCSSYATFVCFFDYPEATYGITHDPNLTIQIDNDPGAGSLITNGNGHCMVPMLKTVGDDLYGYATIGEASGLFTRMVNFYSNYVSTDVAVGAFGNNDLRNYIFRVNLKDDLNVLCCLDVSDQDIVNGSARPYKGDGSVYTTKEDVIINIKDPDATRLYYQKVTGSFSRGRPTGTLTADGDAQYVSITAGTTQVTLRTKTTAGSYSGVELEHGAVYAVWASVGSAQTTKPSDAEYFEWHDLAQEQINYSYNNGVLVTDDEFWYARGYGKNYRNPIRGNNGGLVSIPYEKPLKSMDGQTTEEHSDYSKYAEKYVLDSSHQMFFFRKGKLGNYLASGTIGSPDPDPD